jgi:hypothetical protein
MTEAFVKHIDHDHVRISRSTISRGQTFRLTVEDADDGSLTVDLQVGNDSEVAGHVSGRLRVSDLVPAARALNSLVRTMASALQQKSGSQEGKARLEKIREKYPNAYMPWTADDDQKLIELYQADTAVAKLSAHFGRQPSAIRSRLEKVLFPAD